VVYHVVVELIDTAAPATLESLADALNVRYTVRDRTDGPGVESTLDGIEVDLLCRVGAGWLGRARRAACSVAGFFGLSFLAEVCEGTK
jgi:hypothetical protein